jgi:hypothetical protein
MSTAPDPTGTAVERAREALEGVDLGDPAGALPRLREALELLTAAIDEAMAAAVVDGETLRGAGALAGLSENAVGPRLARTRTLAAYQSEEGRVTAAGVGVFVGDNPENRIVHNEIVDDSTQTGSSLNGAAIGNKTHC